MNRADDTAPARAPRAPRLAYLGAAATALTMALLLAACDRPAGHSQSPSTSAGVENDLAASRPASNVGNAPPIDVATPTK